MKNDKNSNQQKISSGITVDEFKKFTSEFKSESDRAAVILGAAKLDILLYQLVEGHLLPNPSSKDDLLDGEAPLANFSARINICYRLGLIDAELSRALHLVRRIRNSFAHEATGVILDSGAHRDRIRELVAPLSNSWVFPFIIKNNFDGDESASTQFRAAISLVSLRLHGAIERVERVKRDVVQTLIPPEISEK